VRRAAAGRRSNKAVTITVINGGNTAAFDTDLVWPALVRLDVRRARDAEGWPVVPGAIARSVTTDLQRMGWRVVLRFEKPPAPPVPESDEQQELFGVVT
jgi:hypothetical protein